MPFDNLTRVQVVAYVKHTVHVRSDHSSAETRKRLRSADDAAAALFVRRKVRVRFELLDPLFAN